MQITTASGVVAICLSAIAMGQDSGGVNAPRLYAVTTALDMPHLEDNLRYAITQEQRCLTPTELRRLFPILQHPALAGCHLGPESTDADGLRAELVCEGNHGTTGTMLWQGESANQRGVLHIRLGGKNMTFSQSVSARLLGGCGT